MNLYLRLLWLVLTNGYRGKLHIQDESAIRLRVWPNDLDLNGHLNNGRYATMMDLGRIDLLLRAGIVAEMRRSHWFPVVSDLSIQFKRPLKPFCKIDLKTTLVGWDERWFYFKQVFEYKGKACAVGWVQGQLRQGRKHVPTAEILDFLEPRQRPDLPVDSPWIYGRSQSNAGF